MTIEILIWIESTPRFKNQIINLLSIKYFDIILKELSFFTFDNQIIHEKFQNCESL